MSGKTILGHVGWAVVAVAAFAVGSRVGGSKQDQSAGDSGTEHRAISARTGGTSGQEGGSRSAAMRTKSGRSSTPGDGGLSRPGVPQSDAQLEALARQAFKDGNPVNRRLAFTRLLESLTAENAQTLRGYMKEMGADSAQWRDFHYAWGAIDGNAAVANGMKTPERDMAAAMSGFASAYPSEAEAFLRNIPADVKADREELKRGLVSGLADRDPGMATNVVYDLANQGDRRAGELLGIVTSEVLQTMGTEGATEWSQNLPDGDLKGSAMDTVAHALTQRDPQAAAQWAEQFAREDYAARVIEEVGDEWAERDPAAAVNWLESLPSGGGQSWGLRSAFGEWARRDAVAAGEHLMTMSNSPQRDAAVSGFVRAHASRDPMTAIAWADSIGDASARQASLTAAGQALFRRDRQAAQEWLATSGLPPEAQQAVMNPPRRR